MGNRMSAEESIALSRASRADAEIARLRSAVREINIEAENALCAPSWDWALNHVHAIHAIITTLKETCDE